MVSNRLVIRSRPWTDALSKGGSGDTKTEGTFFFASRLGTRLAAERKRKMSEGRRGKTKTCAHLSSSFAKVYPSTVSPWGL